MSHPGPHTPDPWLSLLKGRARCLQPRCFRKDVSGAQHECRMERCLPSFFEEVSVPSLCLSSTRENKVGAFSFNFVFICKVVPPARVCCRSSEKALSPFSVAISPLMRRSVLPVLPCCPYLSHHSHLWTVQGGDSLMSCMWEDREVFKLEGTDF